MASWSGWATVPGGGKTFSPPAVATRVHGALGMHENGLHLFVRGTDDGVHRKRFNGASWGGWKEVPGGRRTPSGPAASGNDDALVVCARDAEGRIFEATNMIGEPDWRPWRELSGGGRTPSEPGAIHYSPHGPFSLNVFVRGTDDGIHFHRDGAWHRIPDGRTGSTPAMARIEPGIPFIDPHDDLHVIVRGTDDGLHHNIFDGRSWRGWSQVPGGGRTFNAPAAVEFEGDVHLLVRGTDGALHANHWDGSWQGWSQVPGGLTPSAPAVTTFEGELYLFVRGTDDGLHFNRLS